MIDIMNVIFEEETPEWDEEAVHDICFARITMTDEEWAETFHDWDISREEAATRIDEEDWSSPYGPEPEDEGDEDEDEDAQEE